MIAWKKPPKKTVAVEKIAQMMVHPKTLQNALPNVEPNAPLKSNNATKFLNPT